MGIQLKDSIFLALNQSQYNAAIQMIQKIIINCSEDLWSKELDEPSFWQQVYHTLYYLDFYSEATPNGFKSPFDVEEDLNKKIKKFITKKNLLDYTKKIEKKMKLFLKSLTTEQLEGKNPFYWTGKNVAERIIYNLRHTQHHIGKLNSILQRHSNNSIKWILTGSEKS